MKRKGLIISLLFFLKLSANGQQFYDNHIHIGQTADSVQSLVVQEVQTHYNVKGWLIKMSAQTIDYKGKPKDIILTKENLLIPIFNKGVNVSVHFVMENDTLAQIITQYPNLSFDEAKQLLLLNRHRIKILDYYFDRDYKAYNQVYVADNGLVTNNYSKTIVEQLPLSVQEALKMLRKVF